MRMYYNSRWIWISISVPTLLLILSCTARENSLYTIFEEREVVFGLQGGTKSIEAFQYGGSIPVLSSITVLSYEDYPFPGRYSKEQLDSLDHINWESLPWVRNIYKYQNQDQSRMEIDGLVISINGESRSGIYPVQIEVTPSESPRMWSVHFLSNSMAHISSGSFLVIQH